MRGRGHIAEHSVFLTCFGVCVLTRRSCGNVCRTMFSWKGEERVEWHGMEVQRLRDSSAQDDLLPRSDDAGSQIAAAASAGDVARLIELLAHGECVVNEQDQIGNTPLFHAVLNDRADTVRALLSCGANPDLQNDRGRSPLHAASARGDHSACARVLVDAGAGIAACDVDQQTPLECARLASCAGVVAALLEAAHRPRPPWQSEQLRLLAELDPLRDGATTVTSDTDKKRCGEQ
jgi:hypothetical protein